MKSREVSGRDTRTGGLCTDEVLDAETRHSAAWARSALCLSPLPIEKPRGVSSATAI